MAKRVLTQCCFLKRRWAQTIAAQIKRKQVVATEVTRTKSWLGITKLRPKVVEIIRAEKARARAGTCRLDKRLRLRSAGFLTSWVNSASSRPVVYKELLQAEAAAVKTTKFTTSAAPGIPISLKTITKGLLLGSSRFHGYRVMITAKAPM